MVRAALAGEDHLGPSWRDGAADNIRALYSEVVDEAASTSLLDSIPGAFDWAQQGLREIRSGDGIPLDDL